MHQSHPAHDDVRAVRLRTAIGVLDRRIHRAQAHGLDHETTLALEHALAVVRDNIDEEARGVVPGCPECGATVEVRDGSICPRCWSSLGVLLGLEPD